MLVFLLIAVVVEAAALCAVALVLFKKNLHDKYSPFVGYLLAVALSDISYVILRGLYISGHLPFNKSAALYTAIFNMLFLAQCMCIFFLVRDLYREATAFLPGMQSLGTAIFYMSIGISGVMALSATASPHPSGYSWIAIALLQIERCSCILVLCLFTFFAFAAQKLGMTYGSRVFGVTFGMAILATNRLVTTALTWNVGHHRWMMVSLVSEFVQVGAIMVWMAYFVKAEPERRLVTVDLGSSLVRWNEVARFFDKPAGQVVVSSPSTFIPAVQEVAHMATRTGPMPPTTIEARPAVAAVR